MIILTIIISIILTLCVYIAHKNYKKRLDAIEQELRTKNGFSDIKEKNHG